MFVSPFLENKAKIMLIYHVYHVIVWCVFKSWSRRLKREGFKVYLNIVWIIYDEVNLIQRINSFEKRCGIRFAVKEFKKCFLLSLFLVICKCCFFLFCNRVIYFRLFFTRLVKYKDEKTMSWYFKAQFNHLIVSKNCVIGKK